MSAFRAHQGNSRGARFNPWNQLNCCALEATEPSARVYAEPGTMWTTPVSF